ncbi:MAG TPA: heavy-metal-associated domain-containing protein [Terracidiphilus sp.]|nr:heavy-metal-associated domain-containing protein [Terracidiphilus sp.]
MEKIVKLKIEGMHCEGCVRRVTQALNALAGVRVESVEVGSAAVILDPARVSPRQVAAAVNSIGFAARAEQ